MCICVHVYLCVYMHMHTCVFRCSHPSEHMEVRSSSWLSSLLTLHLIVWNRVAHWAWAGRFSYVSHSLRPWDPSVSPPEVLEWQIQATISVSGTRPSFYTGDGGEAVSITAPQRFYSRRKQRLTRVRVAWVCLYTQLPLDVKSNFTSPWGTQLLILRHNQRKTSLPQACLVPLTRERVSLRWRQ